MEASHSIIRLRPGNPPLEVISSKQKVSGGSPALFTAERCLRYTIGKRLLAVNITEMGYAGRVNVVYLNFSEETGKGSSADLNVKVIKDDRYGVLSYTNSKFVGSFDSFKENYCVPSLPDAEILCYVCRETGSGSCLTLVKKKDKMQIAETVKATHAFIIDEELTYNISIKITSNKKAGLIVEVEGPTKLTMDYTKQLVSAIREKMENQMDASTIFPIREAMRRYLTNGSDREIDGGSRQSYTPPLPSNDEGDDSDQDFD